jgi:hypothetical protein
MNIETKTIFDKLEDFIQRPLSEDNAEINAYHRVRAFVELVANQQIEEMGLAWEAGHVDSMRLVNEKTGEV